MFHYYLKKIQYLFFPKKIEYPKTVVEYFFKNQKTSIISFSSIAGSKRSTQTNEFFSLTKKFNVLFVKDIERSWFNSVDVQHIKSFLQTKEVSCIGHSMGAFNAIMFSNFYPIKKILAFSPQFSIHPNISKDKTYLNYAASIKKWKFNKILFNKKTEYCLVFGDTKEEMYHMNKIPNQKNIKKIIINNCDHNTAPILKKRGKLKPLINSFFQTNI